MPKLDVCLEMVFCGRPCEERIGPIAREGYDCVEFWFHDATFDGRTCDAQHPKDPRAIAEACREHGVSVNNLVLNAPDGSFGGAPVNAGDRARYLERLDEVIEFGAKIGCRTAITCTGNLQPGLSRPQMRGNLEQALGAAAAAAEKNGFTLLLEPLNTLVDHVGYYLDSSAEGAEIVKAIGKPSLQLLYDVYHMQIMEGNIMANIGRHLDVIGHFHSAGVPGRHELDEGELNYPHLLAFLDRRGYTGRFGLEYSPALADHGQSLRRVRDHLAVRNDKPAEE